jgi:hypothetical protein
MEQVPFGTEQRLSEYLYRQLNQLEIRLNDLANTVHKDKFLIQYTFSTTTTDTDPGTGALQINNAAKASATYLYISKFPLENIHMNGVFDYLKTRDTITLSLSTNVSDYAKFYVSGPAIASGAYYKIPLLNINYNGAEFANGSTLNVQVDY